MAHARPLPRSIPIVQANLNVPGRSDRPFLDAAAAVPALHRVACLLDEVAATYVDGIRVTHGDAYHDPAILFTVHTKAFAVVPAAAEAARTRLYTAEVLKDATFPNEEYDELVLATPKQEAQLTEWLGRELPDPECLPVGALGPYRGPRLFGEHLMEDVVGPVVLEGCQLL